MSGSFSKRTARWSWLQEVGALGGLTLVLLVTAIAAGVLGASWAFVFTSAALLAAVARTALNVREGRRVIKDLDQAMHVDPLTGLGNRRALLERLELGPPSEPWMLAVFRLDGMDRYGEAHGRLAADALVRRLGQRLAATVADAGAAFRPAFDRFAVVQRVGRAGFEPLLAAATAALSEEGEGFCIDALAGVVLLPDDASTAPSALAIAEEQLRLRRRSHKLMTAPSLERMVADAVARHHAAVTAGTPTLADLARATAERLGLTPLQRARASLASELYDIGDLAVPREILAETPSRGEVEWEFVEHHSALGERIVDIAIAAPEVAALIRASHEHFDGSGEPDGLSGSEIPVEARVAMVCAAFEAMLTSGPRRPSHSRAEAVDELRAAAGSRFDPEVVRAFSLALAAARSRDGDGHLLGSRAGGDG